MKKKSMMQGMGQIHNHHIGWWGDMRDLALVNIKLMLCCNGLENHGSEQLMYIKNISHFNC